MSEITVKVHRAQVVRKMSADSLPELARMADKLKLSAHKLTLDRAHAARRGLRRRIRKSVVSVVQSVEWLTITAVD
jgi:DNA-binding NarL/FixJ family response regulator